MRTPFFILVLSTLLLSCIREYRNSSNLVRSFNELGHLSNDTLIATFQSCTECLDLVIVDGEISLSNEWEYEIAKTLRRDIKICGDFPLDFIDMSSFGFKSGQYFKIIGKVIGIDSSNAVSKAPLFYVDEWDEYDFYESTISP